MMKKTHMYIRTTTTALLLGACISLTARAHPPGRGDRPERPERPARPERPERPAHPEKMRERMRERLDTDGDGQLSDEEKAAGRAAMQERRAQALKTYDADGDGTLSAEERQKLRDDRMAERRAKMLERFDTDGDGTLSDAEKEAARAARPEGARRRDGKGPKGDRPAPPAEGE